MSKKHTTEGYVVRVQLPDGRSTFMCPDLDGAPGSSKGGVHITVSPFIYPRKIDAIKAIKDVQENEPNAPSAMVAVRVIATLELPDDE